MAHRLNFKDGKASMVYFGQKPWHGLGTELKKPATAAEVMIEANMNFTVEKRPIFFQNKGKFLSVPDEFANVRTDTNTALGVVGKRYEIVQNSDAFTFFDALIGKGEAIYHTAGVLDEGQRIWLLAKLPDFIKIKTISGKMDEVDKFVLLTSSHDGTHPTIAKLTPIRVVCNNTLSAALQGHETEVRIRHTKTAIEKLEEAHRILNLTNMYYKDMNQIFSKMSLTKINDKQLMDYIKTLVPDNEEAEHHTRTENVRSKVKELYETGQGAEMTRGSLWGAYNAITEYVDHVKFVNKDGKSVKLGKIWFGKGERLKQAAFDKALVLVNN